MDIEGSQPQSAVTWVRKNSKHTGSMKTILIMLADFIDDGNDCPSQKELAAAAGLSTDTVRRVLGELVKDKTITVTKAGGKKVKGGQRDCYAINRPATADETTTPDATRLQEPSRTQQHGSPLPDGMEQPGSKSEDAPAHVSDAATRVTDMSLRAKEKDKNTPLTPQGDAPDGASVVSNKPKRVRKQPEILLKDDEYHRLRRGVAMRSWGIDPDNPEMRAMLGNDDFGRIGKIVSWLRGIKASPAKLAEFYAWYKQQYPTASAPKDLDKFKGHFAAFVQSKIQSVAIITNPAYVPVVEREHMPVSEVVTIEEMERIEREFKARHAQRQGVPL